MLCCLPSQFRSTLLAQIIATFLLFFCAYLPLAFKLGLKLISLFLFVLYFTNAQVFFAVYLLLTLAETFVKAVVTTIVRFSQYSPFDCFNHCLNDGNGPDPGYHQRLCADQMTPFYIRPAHETRDRAE